MMDDLITKKQAVSRISDLLVIELRTTRLPTWNEVYNAIKEIQPVDAVEVVRCKDCKYFDGECCDRYADETLGYSHSTQPNFFCAVGERKTDV